MTNPHAQALIAQALTPVLGAPKAVRARKGKAVKAPKGKRVALPAAYVPGPTALTARKGTWRSYMVGVTLKASTPADATKAHKAKARKAGFNPAQPLDFRWMLAQGYIAPAK